MRKGLKWSDGAPCTADDYLFFWDDNLYNESVQPTREAFLEPGGIRSRCEKIDDYTFKVIFALPNPGFVDMKMAHVSNIDVVLEPKHYLQQFHKTYNQNADALAESEGFDNWAQLFLRQRNRGVNLDKPVLECMEPVDESPEAVFHDRNAYFFMLDGEGNQLPYIDEMLVNRVADLEMLNAKTIGAQFDFSAFDISIENYPAYDDAAEQGDYRIILWPSGKGGEVVYNFNMNWNMEEGIPTDQQEPDMWRDVFSDVRFRRAMSLAINRDEINNIIFFGRGQPRQMTVIPQSRFFKPEYAEAYAQYDPDQANALLDEVGLRWDDAGQQRLWPDGTPINISWDMYESETPKGPITELVNEYWRAVGIVTNYKSITRELLNEKVLANQEPISLWHGDETGDSLFLRGPKFFTPENGDESAWAVYWGLWYETHGERGVEPPPEIKEIYDAQDLYHRTAGPEGPQIVLESNAENLWTIGTVGMAPHPLIVKNNLRNIAEEGLWTWDSLWTWPTYPETWFFAQ
jgi:peptide/nickel transport system substrate-binding protein